MSSVNLRGIWTNFLQPPCQQNGNQIIPPFDLSRPMLVAAETTAAELQRKFTFIFISICYNTAHLDYHEEFCYSFSLSLCWPPLHTAQSTYEIQTKFSVQRLNLSPCNVLLPRTLCSGVKCELLHKLYFSIVCIAILKSHVKFGPVTTF